jgi:hypothetical protein
MRMGESWSCRLPAPHKLEPSANPTSCAQVPLHHLLGRKHLRQFPGRLSEEPETASCLPWFWRRLSSCLFLDAFTAFSGIDFGWTREDNGLLSEDGQDVSRTAFWLGSVYSRFQGGERT